MARKTIGDAFGGQLTTLEEQREIWAEALHEDAIWEGPTFEKPIQMIGREATGKFMELLLQHGAAVLDHPGPGLSDQRSGHGDHQSYGGGPTDRGGEYTQRYFSLITNKNGLAFRMREYCNPFQTYKAFGKERWEAATDEIMSKYNAPWPARQAPTRSPCRQ